MSRVLLTACSDLKKFILGKFSCGYGFLENEVSFSNGSGLIHNDCLDVSQGFQSNTAFEQNTFLGTGTDTGEECQRYT